MPYLLYISLILELFLKIVCRTRILYLEYKSDALISLLLQTGDAVLVVNLKMQNNFIFIL